MRLGGEKWEERRGVSKEGNCKRKSKGLQVEAEGRDSRTDNHDAQSRGVSGAQHAYRCGIQECCRGLAQMIVRGNLTLGVYI